MKNKPLIFTVIIIALFCAGVGYWYFNKSETPASETIDDSVPVDIIKNTDDGVVGGDRDEHGCIGSAGYSWCEGKQKCLRIWEEPCEADTGSLGCAVENCHGMDIKCGSNPPDVCTEIYMIGDKCLQYAKCGVQDGRCRQVEDPEFTKCKSCVQNCIDTNMNDNMKVFECESKCD